MSSKILKRTGFQEFYKNALLLLPNVTLGPGLAKTGFPLHMFPGDDAELQVGLPLTSPRFVDFSDGTIYDNVTGLMWIQDPGLCAPTIGINGIPEYLSWETAINACEALIYAEHSDWRMPNIRELSSLLYFDPWAWLIDGDFFPNIKNAPYWSSTTYADDAAEAWCAKFNGLFSFWMTKTYHVYVLPVRGGHINA